MFDPHLFLTHLKDSANLCYAISGGGIIKLRSLHIAAATCGTILYLAPDEGGAYTYRDDDDIHLTVQPGKGGAYIQLQNHKSGVAIDHVPAATLAHIGRTILKAAVVQYEKEQENG